MPRTFTSAEILTRCKERADMESSNFISDAEWYRYISGSYAELYDMLVKAQPDYYAHDYSFSTTAGTTDYAVPTSVQYYGAIVVEYKIGSNYVELDYVNGKERNRYDSSTSGPANGYHFTYNTTTPSTPMIRLLPGPGGGEVYRVRYIVAPEDITTSTATIDGVAGWEEYVVLDAAIKALTKEESPTGALERQLERMNARILSMAENRTIGDAGHVTDIYDTRRIFDNSSWRNRP